MTIDKQYELKYHRSTKSIEIKRTVTIDDEDYSKSDHISYEKASEIFKYFYKEYYINRRRKEICGCLDGAYDNCEVCCPDSWENYVFRDDLEDK